MICLNCKHMEEMDYIHGCGICAFLEGDTVDLNSECACPPDLYRDKESLLRDSGNAHLCNDPADAPSLPEDAGAIRIRLWQLSGEADPAKVFICYDDLLSKFGSVKSSEYIVAFDGFVHTWNLEDIYIIFRESFPVDYGGRKIGLGDVIELNGRFHYCDRVGFRDITQEWNGV